MDSLERNKQNAMAFYALAFNEGQPSAAVERFVGDEYVQHNPRVMSGKKGFITYFEQMARQYQDKVVTFKRVVAEGDMVVLHTHQVWPGSDDYASIDIFRFTQDGKIVEHWDVLQVIPDEMVHDNGMF